MHQIAICDDEKEELDKTEWLLYHYGEEHPEYRFTIRRFDNEAQLLSVVKGGEYVPDLLLLDIYLPDRLGTEVAKELRDLGKESRIIFLTTSTDHALDAFRVDALQYLVKPVSEAELFAALDKFLWDIEDKRKKYLLLRIEGMTHRVEVDAIVFLEAQGKRQCMHLADGTQVVLHMTMTELFRMLSRYQKFVRVGAAYIVNLEFIDSLNSHNICLDTGRNIYLPRGAFQPLKKQYFQYYCEEKKAKGAAESDKK